MFNVGKFGFALSSRGRVMANVKDIDGQFINAIKDNGNLTPPVTLGSNQNQKLSVNAWGEIGVSMGMPLINKEKHFLKGGITIKYLAGAFNGFVGIGQLKGSINADASGNYFLQNTTGNVGIGYAGPDISKDFNASNLKLDGSGIGGDLGFVYEFRPDATLTGKDQNKYKFKIGLSLLDIGSIKYKPKAGNYGNYTVKIGGAPDAWYPSDLDGKSLSEIQSYLDTDPHFTNNGAGVSSYSAALPTTVQLNFDLHLNRGFYINLGGQMNLANKSNLYSSYYYNGVTLTPRIEGKILGFSLPINYNELSNFNVGASFRLGPLFFGSGSVITALFDKSKQLDAHFGIRFGMPYKKAKVKEAPPAPIQAPPPADSDGDGISDDNDKCPNVKGLARYNGCPIPDTDNDGVNDEEDKCPALAGPASNQGCPEIKAEVKKRIDVAAKNVFFATGSSKLLAKSNVSLNEVAKILAEDPNLKLDVEGHTDNTGKPDKNQILSEERAKSVVDYLTIKAGVDASRLTSAGFGQDQPIADNKTAAGRAKNRRVDLKLHYN
jgi:outer membrane protein OmpA-like peptidoglycan-associated protein